jgi:drug efflux transport system permease protein
MMLERIGVILQKEFRQAFRDPRMRILLFLPPLVQLILFGYAVNLDVENTRMAWMDQDRTPESRELLAAFQGSIRFQVVAAPRRDDDVRRLMDGGKVQLVIRVLPGFARDLARGRTVPIQVLVDGTNSNTASLVRGYADQIIYDFSAKALDNQMEQRIVTKVDGSPASREIPGLEARSRVWFNPDLESRNYFVPGVVANIIFTVTLMLTALAIVREKEIGTMEQLMVTPIRPLELMIGKMLPFAVVGLVDVVLITSAAVLIFRIPFRGSAWLLMGCSILLLLTSLGAGLFMSTISQTQQQAVMASFFFALPVFMLSGFAFPIRNMPVVVQYLTYLNPLRYFVEIVRGIFLKGTGLAVLWPQMLALAVYGTGVVWLSAVRFYKKLD